MTEHTHSWAADNGLAGIACRDCHTSGWDWQQDEIKRCQEFARREEETARQLAFECERLRGELALWQQRFGDAQATLLRQNAVVEAARQTRQAAIAMKQCGETGTDAWRNALLEGSRATAALYMALRLLDEVPQRAASPEQCAVCEHVHPEERCKRCHCPAYVTQAQIDRGEIVGASPEVAG